MATQNWNTTKKIEQEMITQHLHQSIPFPIQKIKNKCKISIEFQIPATKEQLDHIFNAEDELAKAGVTFDTVYDFTTGRRIWQLDWSLDGAEIKIKKKTK